MGRNDRRSDSSHSAEACCSTQAQKAQHETKDATVKERPSLSLVERLSFRGLGEAVNDELVHAIGGKHLVEFVYSRTHPNRRAARLRDST